MYLADKVGATLGVGNQMYVGQRVGIELEYEKYNGEHVRGIDLWNLIPDNSLRDNGIEFVSTVLPRREIAQAFEQAKKLIELTRVKATPRCGIHVHLNVAPYTWGQLWSLSVLYTLLEPTIFKQYAPERQTSHFCVPSFSNDVLAKTMMEDMGKLRGKDVVAQRYGYDDAGNARPLDPERVLPKLGLLGTNKYTAMNYSRLHDLHTVEFRQLDAYEDLKIVREWVEFLLRMQRIANNYGNEPQAVLDDYERIGLEGLCDKVGLDMQEIDELDQDDAEDVATFMVGYKTPMWEDLEWKIGE
jgi:hypothetical protein